MKTYDLTLHQVNGRMTLQLFDDKNDKKPITYSRSVAPSQWDIARKHLLIAGLKYLTEELEKESND